MKPLPFTVKTALGPALAVLLGTSNASALQGIPAYHVTDLEGRVEQVFPGVQYPGSRSRGLNENGDFVGEASLNGSEIQGWIHTVEHGLVALPDLTGWSSNVPLDVSDRDANGEVFIVGGGVPSTYWDLYLGVAVLWRFSTVTGTVLETRSIGIPAGFSDSLAVAVNNGGTVVGSSGITGPFTNWKYDVSTQVLETFDFPYRVTDLNNAGQVIGGPYRGDLFGGYQDLGAAPGTGSTRLWRINDLGWVMGRAGTGISDGAGHYLAAIVRFADPVGWTVMDIVSHLSMPGGINDRGDFMSRSSVYLDDMNEQYSMSSLLAPEYHTTSPDWSAGINANQQIASYSGHAVLLTPLGRMIIPGDVNGDVQVDLDDHCAWLSAPIDLNDDSVVDGADEAWLIERLAVFGFTVDDCNANLVGDHCDILASVSLDCNENDVPDECEPDCSGDGVPDACEADCNDNGVPDPCDVAQGSSDDCNGNGIPDECDLGSVVQVVNVFDPPLQVLQGATVVDDLLVIDPGVIADVDFTFDIDYRIGFLTVILSYNGTTATLIDLPGVPEEGLLGNGQLGYDIILDDEGTGGPIEDEGNFGSPFEPITSPPSFTPNDPLSVFDGMPSDGVWTVTVTTNPTWGSPGERFNDWGLSLTLASAPLTPCVCQGATQSYCTSTTNSTGAPAVISSNNECVVADNQFQLVATPVPNTPGLFFYGPNPASMPFGDGTLCISGPFQRLGVEFASGNELTHHVDLANPPVPASTIVPGSTWRFQAWFRDAAAGGSSFNLSDALEVTFH